MRVPGDGDTHRLLRDPKRFDARAVSAGVFVILDFLLLGPNMKRALPCA